jgi:hypothetical protein
MSQPKGPIRLGQAPSSPSEIGLDAAADKVTSAIKPVEYLGIGQPQSNVDDSMRNGRLLAQQLEEQGYHPVFIFGTAFSGKTALLSSMLAYPQAGLAPEPVEIALGDPLLPLDEVYGRNSFDYAEYMFNHAVQRYIEGRVEGSTQVQEPFFVPVIVRPQKGPEVRIAFLESRGEWFEPRQETNALYQPLKSEISSVLKHFGRGVSMIYVAPYTQVKLWDDDQDGQSAKDVQLIKTANLGIRGGIQSYSKVRPSRERDAHMFLITKWDAHAQPGNDQDLFNSPTEEQIVHVARSKYTTAFTAFQAMSNTVHPWQKTVRHYCAGIMSGRDILRPNESNAAIIYGFPRRLWNWIYANATRDNGGGERMLFSPPPQAQKSLSMRWHAFMDRVMRLLGV